MKKLTLAIGLYASMLCGAYAQSKLNQDSTQYKNRKLKLEEINLVSSYYSQDGNNSAVTGGTGTEQLTDIANSIDFKLTKRDKKFRLHTFNLDFAIDAYTSASSDKIDPRTISSASMSDTHIYPSLMWSMKNDKTRTTWGASTLYSTEYDYKSYGGNLSFAKLSKDKNRELSVKVGAFFDTWSVILPAELRPATYGSGAEGDFAAIAYKPRNSYNAAFTLSQVINKRLQMSLTVEPAYQEGLLSTPFHRIYFKDGSETVEKLPGNRFKIPIGLRASYFLGDHAIIRTFYRYYQDDWGMKAHTANLEVPIKLTSFVSVSPFYRFNSQTAVKYFAPYQTHQLSEQYYTSDYDLSKFTSHFFGAGLRLAPPKGVFGIQRFNMIEIRYGHYMRSTGLASNIITLQARIK